MGRHNGPTRYQVGGIEYAVDLDTLADICEGVRWPDDLAPAHDSARRLLQTLGVVGVPEADGDSAQAFFLEARERLQRIEQGEPVHAVSVQALSETRDCVQPLCVDEALPGLEHCRRHAPIRSLAAGREALEAMDAGEQQPRTESANSPTPALTTSREESAVQTCKIPDCDKPAMWKRGRYAHLCVTHAEEKRSGRAVAAEKAKPEPVTAPVVEPPAVRELEPVGTGDGGGLAVTGPSDELAARPDETPDGGGFSLALALTGDFARDAERVRAEASKLRAQAGALDVIATGIDRLAETVA